MADQQVNGSRVLWNVSWRYLVRHPWQSVLMIVGITLGVAVVVAIDLANESASRAFDLSVDSIAGKATHQITGGPEGIGEGVYIDLRKALPDDVPLAPVVEETVYSAGLGDRPLTLLGVDVFAEAPFRSYVAGSDGVPVASLVGFLTEPGAVLISTGMADRYRLAVGDPIDLEIGGRTEPVFVAGLLEPDDSLAARTLDGLILADVATAQEITGRVGRLDRIDAIVAEGDAAALRQIEGRLPAGVTVAEVSARSGSVAQMTAAFRTNLTALSLLALVVGTFLIYNTMTFSVVQRRALFGTLRSLGVTRREVFFLVIGEALIVGVIGAGLGVGLGVLMGQGAVRLVTRTINDLFFVLNVEGVQIPAISLAKGALLGIGATVATAAPPAWEAASVAPRAALRRSNVEEKALSAIRWVAVCGVLVILLGAGTLLIPSNSLLVSFLGTFAVIVGAAMLTPLLMRLILRGVQPLTTRWLGVLGRMAPRSVSGALSRTSIAVAALMVAVSVTIGISVMVGSFRHTVVIWLDQTLQGDIYISAPGGTAAQPSVPVDPQIVEVVESWPDVARVDSVRAVAVETAQGPAQMVAVNNPTSGEARLYLWRNGTPEEVWDQVEGGAVIVSEPYARRNDIPRGGGSVRLLTPQGMQSFPVVAVYYDYGSTQGQVMMAQEIYRDIWGDKAITAVALHLDDAAQVDTVVRALEERLTPVQRVDVQANQALKDEVLVIFDRTFAITGALNILATVVAFIGVLSALLSLQLEKQRELGILRAVGMTVRQVWGLTLLETGLMGAIAGVLSWPTGFALSLILVYIINRRSFGWTLQMNVEAGPFAAALAVAVGAALLAGVYPARRLGRMAASDAIRFE